MPDWSYRTLFRPALFRLPSRAARGFTLGAMGTLSRLPLGPLLIKTLGHMEPAPILEMNWRGLPIRYPVGLAGMVDPDGRASRALAPFGFGFYELGPVDLGAGSGNGNSNGSGNAAAAEALPDIQVDAATETIYYGGGEETIGLEEALARLVQWRQDRHIKARRFVRLRMPAMPTVAPVQAALAEPTAPTALTDPAELTGPTHPTARIAPAPAAPPEPLAPTAPGDDTARADRTFAEAIARLAENADGFYLQWTEDEARPVPAKVRLRQIQSALSLARQAAPGKLLLLYIDPSERPDRLRQLLERLMPGAADGIVVGGAVRSSRGSGADGGCEIGAAAKPLVLDLVAEARRHWPDAVVIAGGGVHEPEDAAELRAAGADAVQVGSGLVFAGPGLPKRINERLMYERLKDEPPSSPLPFWRGWGWMCLLGAGMIIGGLLAWIVAATSVLLPYDEEYLGWASAQIDEANGRVLPFMSHDRITLAGTMISIGIFYLMLGRYGFRYGLHWSRIAATVSAAVGFSSFFLYLGYGYFDPLHAFAAALLLPMFLLAMVGSRDRPSYKPVNRRNDRIWRLALWGQLLWVSLGIGLAVGGLTISYVGITDVFVRTDLAFLCTTSEELARLNERIVPLIAHDRAGFGGALFSLSIVLLGSALWGIQQGAAWLWRTFLYGGLPGFVAGLWVHFQIGYTDFVHLLPVYVALVLYAGGLVLLYPYMVSAAGRDAD